MLKGFFFGSWVFVRFENLNAVIQELCLVDNSFQNFLKIRVRKIGQKDPDDVAAFVRLADIIMFSGELYAELPRSGLDFFGKLRTDVRILVNDPQ